LASYQSRQHFVWVSLANMVLSRKFLPGLCYCWHLDVSYVRLLLLQCLS